MALSLIPRTTHTWLKPLYDALDVIIAFVNTLAGASWKPVRLATITGLPAYAYNSTAKTLTANANGALSVDGVAVAVGNRILVKNESAAAEKYNGVYTVTAAGGASAKYVLTRASDAAASADFVDGKKVTVGEGTMAGTAWTFTTNATFTLDTSAVTFARETDVALKASANTFTAANTFNALVSVGTAQALTGAGAANVTTTITNLTSSGVGDVVTLADGTAGQVKIITAVSGHGGGNTSVITPTTTVGTWTTATLDTVGEGVTLVWTGTDGWAVVGSNGATIA